MGLPTFFGKRQSVSCRNGTERIRRHAWHFRPCLDVLEDRTAPAVLTVNTLADETTADNVLSLREAIGVVNAGSTSGLSAAELAQVSGTLGSNDTIQFDPSLFVSQQTITLGGSELLLSSSVIINGPGLGDLLVISGNNASRVFEVASGANVTLSGLIVQNGTAGAGGGISNTGTLTISDCTVSQNFAGQIGGGIFSSGTMVATGCTVSGNTAAIPAYSGSGGGGIALAYNYGVAFGYATISDCVVSGNSTQYNGGGIWAGSYETLTITDSIVSGNTAGEGAGIFSAGAVNISGCTVSGNATNGDGDGILNFPPIYTASSAGPGYVIPPMYTNTLTISGSTISGNSAGDGGGIENDGDMAVSGTTISGNSAGGAGGGINNVGALYFSVLQVPNTLTLTTSALWGNSAWRGGGICTFGGVAVTVTDSTLVDNSAVDSGGGIYTTPGAFIYTYYSSVTITGSTLSGNTAATGVGGGIENNWPSGVAVGSHSAIVDNLAPAAPARADLDSLNGSDGTVSVDESTIVNFDSPVGTYVPITYTNASDTATALTASVNAHGQIVYTAHVLGVNTAVGSSPLTVTSGTVLLHYNGNTATMALDSNTGLYNLSPISDPAQLASILASPSPLYAEFVPAASSGFNGSTSAHLLQAADALIPSNLQATVRSLASTPATAVALTITPSSEDDAISALNTLTPGQYGNVSVILNLQTTDAQGNPYKYHAATVSLNAGVTLIINGEVTNAINNQTPNAWVDPATPALTVNAGNVIVQNVTFTESGAAPTILVNGGHLTLRNDIVQESTGSSEPAIEVTSGSLDLGTAASPGGNTININGNGQALLSSGVNIITATGDSFLANGSAVFPFAKLGLTSSANPAALNQPVTLTATVTAPNSTSSTPTGTVTFLDTTTGSTLGVVSLVGSSAQLTVATLGLGTHTIAAVYSGNANYVSSSATLGEQISTYVFSGFLPPLNSALPIGLGRIVPIKFQLSNANGFVSNLSVIASLLLLSPAGNNVLTTSGSTALRFDSTSNQFVANWQTKGLPAGSYTLRLALADGTVQTKVIQLSKNGNGANAQAAEGSDINLGNTAGQLLGGDLQVFVDNSNGDLTPEELARIQDAVTAVDIVTAPYGVTVEETTDPTQAEVTLNMDSTSTVGGYANGILGCFDPTAGQITMIQGWNWYAGSDPTQIGASQYDFQTTLTHELGHALGLGESADPTSAMSGTLAPGTVIRTLTTADLNIPPEETGADAQRAAPAPDHPAVTSPEGQSNAGLPSARAPGMDSPLVTGDLNPPGQTGKTRLVDTTSPFAATWSDPTVPGTATEAPAAARLSWPNLAGAEGGASAARPGSMAGSPGGNQQLRRVSPAEIFAADSFPEEANQVGGMPAAAGSAVPGPVDQPLTPGTVAEVFAGLDQANLGSRPLSDQSTELSLDVLTALRAESTLVHPLAAWVGVAWLSSLKEVPEPRREWSGAQRRGRGPRASYA
jgi:hypothetical protein